MPKKNIVITLAMLIAGAILTLMIALNGINMNRSTKEVINTTGYSLSECVGFVFSVQNQGYDPDNGMLSFDIVNKQFGDYDIERLSVESGGQESIIEKYVSIGTQKKIQVNMTLVNSTFRVYVPGCDVYAEEVQIE